MGPAGFWLTEGGRHRRGLAQGGGGLTQHGTGMKGFGTGGGRGLAQEGAGTRGGLTHEVGWLERRAGTRHNGGGTGTREGWGLA